ncbi:GGDEF domain-containing protein [Chitinilyticum piscinae]|uniref:diguanylate cyclase n=1 Tax=Chitinilyticum piscinae TaxID=2866724 RepID=A0A8J7FKN4_9NEIS|nr:GGDEF domain-containing protein [Chitinilyticum piscinae]MBE9609450.1 diguanylate cyclase [Chitinilyticum piscinae]
MSQSSTPNPTVIARETLKQMALRRLVPTPDHYEAIYHEIAGTPEGERLHPMLREVFTLLAASQNRNAPEFERQQNQLKRLAGSEKWTDFSELLLKTAQTMGSQSELTRSWAELIRELILQWDLRNPVYTPSRKQDSLEKVLINFGGNGAELNDKLAALVKAWSEGASEQRTDYGSLVDPAVSDSISDSASAPQTTTSLQGSPAPADYTSWANALASTLDIGVRARLAHTPDLQAEAASLAREAGTIVDAAGFDKMLPRLRKFWLRLELQNDQEQRLCDALMNLLRLLTDNMAEIVIEDDWVRGQIAVVQQIMAQPLDMRVLYDAEAGLKEVLFKQSQLKHTLVEAQEALKQMLASFIDRLGVMSQSTDRYHDRIAGYAGQIEKAKDLASIREVMEGLLQDTRSMQLDVQRSRDELNDARRQADEAHNRVVELEQQLSELSHRVREDQLTGALNRRGMEEMMDTEMARASRNGKPLSLALLDIDNFKKLNDSKGHGAGDDALKHLVGVIKSIIRPMDSVARYGGEEFVLVMPETDTANAVIAMQRVQRELTKRFFLHNNEKLLITFSAGVTEIETGDTPQAVLERADHAMYLAKRGGKNRVEVYTHPGS